MGCKALLIPQEKSIMLVLKSTIPVYQGELKKLIDP
jgi:hypothetical protein